MLGSGLWGPEGEGSADSEFFGNWNIRLDLGFPERVGCLVEPKKAPDSASLHCSLLSALIVSNPGEDDKGHRETIRNRYKIKERANQDCS